MLMMLPYCIEAQNLEKDALYSHVFHQSYPSGKFSFRPISHFEIELEQNKLPLAEWSIELLVLDHVNTPVGFRIDDAEGINYFTYFDKKTEVLGQKFKLGNPFQRYWNHYIITFNEGKITFFQNGATSGTHQTTQLFPLSNKITINTLLANEPHMSLNDLLKKVVVYPKALSTNEVASNWLQFETSIKEGTIPGWQPNFLVIPFVSFATQNSINISWETINPQTAKLVYGEKYPLEHEIIVNETNKIQHITINTLKPATNYFAEVYSGNNNQLPHKIYFKTAPQQTVPFRFGVIGDTESRPFINYLVAEHLWDNRPDFFALLGDLTDGGQKAFKDQWNLEFFSGMNSLMSKVPVVPLAGNGENDLYWFNQYFKPASKTGFYRYSYSNADFFVLRSNQKEELAANGIQYKWLEEELKQSKAEWKFVLLHHAPYSSDEDDYGDSYRGPSEWGDPKVRELVPLFDKYHVDLVFYGHLHCYERTWPLLNNKVAENGVVYVETGGAGGNLEDFAPHRTWFSAKTFRGYHYVMVNINEKYFRMDTYNLSGNLIDTYSIQKE
jgi:acid phosphatase type 7